MIPPMAAPPSAQMPCGPLPPENSGRPFLWSEKCWWAPFPTVPAKRQRGERGLHAVGPGDDANHDLGKDHGVRGLNRRSRGKGKLELVSAVLGVDLLHRNAGLVQR